jgi:hypothetical protein
MNLNIVKYLISVYGVSYARTADTINKFFNIGCVMTCENLWCRSTAANIKNRSFFYHIKGIKFVGQHKDRLPVGTAISTRAQTQHVACSKRRDGNLGTGTRYLSGTRPIGYGDDFLPVGGTRTRSEPRRIRDGYFFPPAGNPTGTRYFTTTIIIDCKQIKMYSFCYINYDLF